MKKLLLTTFLTTIAILHAAAYDCEVDGLRYNIVTRYGQVEAQLAHPDEENVVFPTSSYYDTPFSPDKADRPEYWPQVKDGRKAYGLKEITIPARIT